MNVPSTSLLLLFLLALATAVSSAQDQSSLRLGITIAASADFHRTEEMRFDKNEPRTPLLGSTTGHTGRMGLVAEYRLNERWGVSAHLDYVSGSAQFTHMSGTPDPYEVVFFNTRTFPSQPVPADPNDPRADATYEYRARLKHQHIDLDLVASRILFGDNSTFSFGVTAGPVISRILDAYLSRQLVIVQNMRDGVVVDFTGERANDFIGYKELYYDHVPEKEEWRFGLRGGVFARLGALNGDGVVISPGLYLHYGLTDLVSPPGSWIVHSMIGRIDLTVGL